MEILRVQTLCKTYGTGEAKVDALKTGYTSTTAVDAAMSAAGFSDTTKISKAGLKNVLNAFRDMIFADISVIVVGASGTIVKTTIQRE